MIKTDIISTSNLKRKKDCVHRDLASTFKHFFGCGITQVVCVCIGQSQFYVFLFHSIWMCGCQTCFEMSKRSLPDLQNTYVCPCKSRMMTTKTTTTARRPNRLHVNFSFASMLVYVCVYYRSVIVSKHSIYCVCTQHKFSHTFALFFLFFIIFNIFFLLLSLFFASSVW